MIHRLNHIAIAVPNLQEAVSFYKNALCATVSDPIDLPEHGVTTIFVTLENTKIELLTPLGDTSPIKGFLEKNPLGGIHHICFEVDDVHESSRHLKENKVRVLSDPKIGAHGVPVVFLHPKDCLGCLIELENQK
jgi:methylmalonyl-CoA/ethylmalonyl-CoA epimerase